MEDNKLTFRARFYKYKLHHVLLWILYFIFWTLVYYPYYPSPQMLFAVITIYLIFNACSFYITAYYLFPRFLYRQRYGLFFLWFGLLVVSFSVALAFILVWIYKNTGERNVQHFHTLFVYCFITIITMVGLLAGAKLALERIRDEKKDRARDQQRLESELKFLKAQVNPHFLFNAINSVYVLIKKDPQQAAETLIKLSDLLRFQLYDCSDERIAIEKEIEYINNFIALEKIRRGNKVSVQVDLDDNLKGFQIAPFLLMPFLENAFKHVSNFNDRENHISIFVARASDTLKARFINSMESTHRNAVGGIGLKNVRRRLELLYPAKHELDIQNTNSVYSVNLTLTVA